MFLALYPQVVSSSSTFQIFRDASHLRWLLCPPVYLLSHFPGLRHSSALATMGFGPIHLGKLAGSWQGNRLWHFSCTLDTERSSSTDGSRNYKDKKKHRPKSVSFAVNLYSKANNYKDKKKHRPKSVSSAASFYSKANTFANSSKSWLLARNTISFSHILWLALCTESKLLSLEVTVQRPLNSDTHTKSYYITHKLSGPFTIAAYNVALRPSFRDGHRYFLLLTGTRIGFHSNVWFTAT